MSGGAGSWVQSFGSAVAARTALALGKYNAKVAKANAERDRLAAENEAQQQERLAVALQDDLALSQQAAVWNTQQLEEAFLKQEGAARAVIGASGLAFEGSPLAVLEENARQGEIKKLVSNFQAKLQQRALGEQITQRRYAAELARFGGAERVRLGGQQAALARFASREQANTLIFQSIGQAGLGASQQSGAGTGATGEGRTPSLLVPSNSTQNQEILLR